MFVLSHLEHSTTEKVKELEQYKNSEPDIFKNYW